jgi:hypothetical protein
MHRRGEKYTRFWWESPKERDPSENQSLDGGDGISMDLREFGGVWIVFDWLMMGTSGELL